MSNLPNTIWCEKYRAQTIDDLIIPEKLTTFFKNAIKDPMQFPNLMLHSSGAGLMKTTTAEVLAKELCRLYGTSYKKINSSKDGNKETINAEIMEWGSYNGYSKAPKIVILDETDKCNAKIFLDPLLSSIEELNKSVRFIMTANDLQNFNPYANSRIEVIDFSLQKKEDIYYIKRRMFDRLEEICKLEKVQYDINTLRLLINTFFPDARMMMTRLYSCYLRNGAVVGSDFSVTNSFDKYAKLQDFLLDGDFVAARTIYNSIPPENDIFSALMSDLVDKITDPIKQMRIVCAIRKHMVPHNGVIDKEINIASMFAEIILILKGI